MFKQIIIDAGANALLGFLQKRKEKKGESKIAKFLFSEGFQNTLGMIYKEYNEALEEWEEMNENN